MIRLTKPWRGYAAGDEVSLAPATEARLVAQQAAKSLDPAPVLAEPVKAAEADVDDAKPKKRAAKRSTKS